MTLNNFKKSFSLNLKLSLLQLLVSNVHLGHTRKCSNSKIKPFLLGHRNDIYLLNVNYTLQQFKLLSTFLINIISLRQKFLIVKDRDSCQFKDSIKIKNVFYFDKKWIGGLLTNFKKIRNSEKFKREHVSFNSMAAMRYMPSCVFFFDVNLSHWALKESMNLEIPISAIVDSDVKYLNSINYPVVGNNKSFECLFLYSSLLKNSVIKGRQKELVKILRIV